MFIPQVDETDVYDASGRQIEDVNSLVDFIHVSLHPRKNHHKPDTDDDNARYFHAAKLGHYFYQPFFAVIDKDENNGLDQYPPLHVSRPGSVFAEIQSPPPKAFSSHPA
ncbi:MAG: hypothetical protein ACXVMS_10920 [Flavisolibacter sp.]